MTGALLLPNVGAEEGAWRAVAREPAVHRVGGLWRLLFGSGAELLATPDGDERDLWPAALGPLPEAPVFDWLAPPPGETRVFAWLNTEEASQAAAERGATLAGAPPDVVRRVHDKAFAHRAALAERLVPPSLRPCVHVLEPEELAEADPAVRRIGEILAAWPAWARKRFALKPRHATSGRGRVAGTDGRADTEAIRGALPRLVARGGALLEPWLERTEDLSAQLFVGDRDLVLLGTLAQTPTPAGGYAGHAGTIDRRGRVTSGSPHDEALREAAVAVALAAKEAGYRGPCGVDGFAYVDPEHPGDEPRLRPVVELNARFTVGTIALGLMRRALPWLRKELRLPGGERRAWRFTLDASDAAADAATARLLFGARDAGHAAFLFTELHEARESDAADAGA